MSNIGGGALPPQSEYWGAGAPPPPPAPPAPTPLYYAIAHDDSETLESFEVIKISIPAIPIC